ncbi:MAG: hypothetical protein KF688_15030 [Pirellulales bacterium]|nr:hypothetical protein [Pirellulales bacterium]
MVVAMAAIGWPQFASSQTTSTWTGAGATSDWFMPANWSTAVPDAAGDKAIISGNPPRHPEAGNGSVVRLGELELVGIGSLEVAGAGTLLFEEPGDALARLRGVSIGSRAVSFTVSPAVNIAAGETLEVDVGTSATLTLARGFTSAAGDVQKTGQGMLILNSGSPSWDGSLAVDQGSVLVNSSNALGTAAAGTTVNGGTLILNSSTSESILLRSGSIDSYSSDRISPSFSLSGPLVVGTNNTASLRGRLQLTGGVTGPGDLGIASAGRSADVIANGPLNQAGALRVLGSSQYPASVSLFADNGYQGPTEIEYATAIVHTAMGLGSSAAPTAISNGTLRLHAESPESVTARNSTIELWSAETTTDQMTPGGVITLDNSTLTNYAQFRFAAEYSIAQPLQLTGSVNSIKTSRGAITLSGGAAGSGKLILNPGQFPINIVKTIDAGINLELQGGATRFLVPMAYEGDIEIRSNGHFIVETDQRVRSIRSGGGVPAEPINIQVAPGATLVAERIDIQSGLVQGNVQTPNGLRFSGFVQGRVISHVDSGIPIQVLAGELTINDSVAGRNATNGQITLGRSRGASLMVQPGSTTEADLHLNNGSGFANGGALLVVPAANSVSNEAVLKGALELGDHGAYIGGNGAIRLEGRLRGGDLTIGRQPVFPAVSLGLVSSRPVLKLVGYPAEHVGATRVYGGELVVAEAGRLPEGGRLDIFNTGAAYIDLARSDGPLADRIPDDVSVRMHGGILSVWPSVAPSTSREHISRVELVRGLSVVQGLKYLGGQQSQGDLVVDEIVRQPGAVMSVAAEINRASSPFNSSASSSMFQSLVLMNSPGSVNGILPAWIHAGGFAQISAEGRVSDYTGPYVPLEQATETHIASAPPSQGAGVLSGDRTVYGLVGGAGTGMFHLGGHTMTIDGGGLLAAKIDDGVVQPGKFADGELVVFGSFEGEINAGIVDNGRPTSVTYAASTKVGGNNTYTGKTYIAGSRTDVTVTNVAALPVGGDIEISGGELILRDPSPDARYSLGNVAVRDNGSLALSCCGLNPSATVESLLLESGLVELPLTGNSPITKRTDGIVQFGGVSNPDYSGDVHIEEGSLHLYATSGRGGYLALGSATVAIDPEGTLVLDRITPPVQSAAPTPTVMLRGGMLAGRQGNAQATTNLKGDLFVSGDSTLSLLDGLSTRPLAADFSLDGSIRLAAGASLTLLGTGGNSGVLKTQGFDFEPGSVLAGTGLLSGNIVFGEDATIAPGLLDSQQPIGMLGSATGAIMELRGGGRYRWEINHADGVAGGAFGLGGDLLLVGDRMVVNATPENPFVFEPVPLNSSGVLGHVDELQLNHHYRWMIVGNRQLNSFIAKIEGFDPRSFEIDLSSWKRVYADTRADRFWLDQDEYGIYLNAIHVPEPASVALLQLIIVIGIAASLTRRRTAAAIARQARYKAG